MLKEFKEFALRGNVLDLAIGIIIGVAFGSIVNSLVNDIIMPPIGMLLGKIDFANLFINLSGQPVKSVAEAKAAGQPVIAYGLFINAVISFIIVAFVVFLIVRWINSLKKPSPAAPSTKECPYCFSSIPDKATRCPDCTSELTGTQTIIP